MSKHYFPSNYKPKYNLEQTIKFINKFKELLVKQIKETFSSQLISFPLVKSVNEFEITDLFPRNIIFDNANSNNLFSFNQNPINFFIQKSFEYPAIKSFYSFTNIINRDSLLTNTSSLVKEVLYLYIFAQNISALETCFKKIANQVVSFINEALTNSSFKLDDKKILKFSTKNTYEIFNRKIVDKQKFIEEFIYNNYPILLIGTPINNSNEEQELKLSDVKQPFYSASFYIYISKLNSELRLFKISPIDKTENEEKDGKNFLIQFDLSNIYAYVLDKVHIAEVVSSSWSQEFEEFVKSNNIKIM